MDPAAQRPLRARSRHSITVHYANCRSTGATDKLCHLLLISPCTDSINQEHPYRGLAIVIGQGTAGVEKMSMPDHVLKMDVPDMKACFGTPLTISISRRKFSSAGC